MTRPTTGNRERLMGCAHDLAKSRPWPPVEIHQWLEQARDWLERQGVPDPEDTALDAFELAADLAVQLHVPVASIRFAEHPAVDPTLGDPAH